MPISINYIRLQRGRLQCGLGSLGLIPHQHTTHIQALGVFSHQAWWEHKRVYLVLPSPFFRRTLSLAFPGGGGKDEREGKQGVARRPNGTREEGGGEGKIWPGREGGVEGNKT